MRVITKRHYEDPPLEEAIFELFVPPSGGPWSASHGEELAKLLPAYSGKREDLEDLNVYFKLGPGRDRGKTAIPQWRRRAQSSRATSLPTAACAATRAGSPAFPSLR